MPAKETMESKTPSEARIRRVRRRRWCAGRSGASRRRGRDRTERAGDPAGGVVAKVLPPVRRPKGGQVRNEGAAPATIGHPKEAATSTFSNPTPLVTTGQAAGTSSSAGAGVARCAGSATGGFVPSHGHTSFHSCPTWEASLLACPLYRPWSYGPGGVRPFSGGWRERYRALVWT